MRRVHAKNTFPELSVRKTLRELGYPGYRLHRRDLPGTPDIAFVGRRKIIFVHGCFWHGHDCKGGRRKPKTNQEYWQRKIQRNRLRDAASQKALMKSGWSVLIVWECYLRQPAELAERLRLFMEQT